MAPQTFDRSREDIGNIVFLEHCNVRVPEQVTATAFYVQAMGFTRDPYVMTGVEVAVQVGKGRARMGQWETVLVEAGTELTIRNASDDPGVVFLVLSPPPRPTI